MSRFQINDTTLDGLKVIERSRLQDSRGFLSRLFCSDELREVGWAGPVAQINHTLTRNPGSVRGMHFQYPPCAEIKLVSCIRGEVWDVAVDLRHGSPTFLQWSGHVISPDNGHALLIPKGFAHGFQALSANCELLYLHSHPYCTESEGGIHPQDPRLAIPWPLVVSELSARDSGHPYLASDFQGIAL